MKWLRKILDSQAPLFKENGKLEKLYPLYEAADTFLYTPGEVTRGPSHVRDALDLKRMMSIVVSGITTVCCHGLLQHGLSSQPWGI